MLERGAAQVGEDLDDCVGQGLEQESVIQFGVGDLDRHPAGAGGREGGEALHIRHRPDAHRGRQAQTGV